MLSVTGTYQNPPERQHRLATAVPQGSPATDFASVARGHRTSAHAETAKGLPHRAGARPNWVIACPCDGVAPACPLGDGLVSQPQALTDLWRWRRDAQDGQGPATAIPGWRDDQGQHDPAKATGADGALAAGSQRVAVMTALVDASAPASLQRFVNDEREAAASGIEGLHQQGQQTATAFESGPASTIEHLMVETERRGIALPRVSQGGRDGASSVGQQGSDEQALGFAPSGCAKETLKGCQEGARRVPGCAERGIADLTARWLAWNLPSCNTAAMSLEPSSFCTKSS